MSQRLNQAQSALLQWIAAGNPAGAATNPQRVSARALASRRLVTIKGRCARWTATLTNAGRHYLEHDDYPPGHFGPVPQPRTPQPAIVEHAPPTTSTSDHSEHQRQRRGRDAKPSAPPKPEVDLTVDSPAGKRRRGHAPLGDSLFSAEQPDAYNEKILITVKEAAWMLSLPEHAIRAAVSTGDLDRVFIGDGTRNYRIVYGSLLAWVNSMPREPAHNRWWR